MSIGDVDERFRALLEGLRTSLPGVQVLFGFLLVGPFQREFSEYDSATIISFTVAFLSAGLASVLLIAPSVHQRVRAPMSGLPRRSERHLTIAIWLTIAGTVVMGVAIVATVLLVSTFVFADVWAVLAAAVLAGGIVVGLVLSPVDRVPEVMVDHVPEVRWNCDQGITQNPASAASARSGTIANASPRGMSEMLGSRPRRVRAPCLQALPTVARARHITAARKKKKSISGSMWVLSGQQEDEQDDEDQGSDSDVHGGGLSLVSRRPW